MAMDTIILLLLHKYLGCMAGVVGWSCAAPPRIGVAACRHVHRRHCGPRASAIIGGHWWRALHRSSHWCDYSWCSSATTVMALAPQASRGACSAPWGLGRPTMWAPGGSECGLGAPPPPADRFYASSYASRASFGRPSPPPAAW